MGRFVIVAYRPKENQGDALLELVKKHLSILKQEDLVTDKPAYVMRSEGGDLVEVFEWRSVHAIEQAHANPKVVQLWEEFARVCDFVPLQSLPETSQIFAEFDSVPVP